MGDGGRIIYSRAKKCMEDGKLYCRAAIFEAKRIAQ
jgi:hypothetical protein